MPSTVDLPASATEALLSERLAACGWARVDDADPPIGGYWAKLGHRTASGVTRMEMFPAAHSQTVEEHLASRGWCYDGAGWLHQPTGRRCDWIADAALLDALRG